MQTCQSKAVQWNCSAGAVNGACCSLNDGVEGFAVPKQVIQ
jgi:hypothetical protein